MEQRICAYCLSQIFGRATYHTVGEKKLTFCNSNHKLLWLRERARYLLETVAKKPTSRG